MDNKTNVQSSALHICLYLCGHDVRKLEPKYRATRLTIWTIDPIIQELRAIFKVHPGWFEVPKQKSVKGKNEVDYSIK